MPPPASSPLHAMLLDRARAEGALPFPAFMEMALYHPEHGYYARPGFTTGRQGDFATAPDAGPLFGATLARAVTRFLEAGPGRLVEVGPGSGRLVGDVLDHLPGHLREAAEVVLVDPFPQHHQRLQAVLGERGVAGTVVEELAELPPARSFVVLNEVLDALPAHVLERTGDGWQALHVDEDEGELVEAWAPCPPEVAALAERCAGGLDPGQRYELSQATEGMVGELSRITDPGVVALFDYGDEHQQVWPHKPEGTLRGFRGHRVVDPLDRPGETDITYDVDFTRLQAVARDQGFQVQAFGPQERLLVHLGLVQVAQATGQLEAVKDLVVPGGGFGGRFQALVLDKGDVGAQVGLAADLRAGDVWSEGLSSLRRGDPP